MKPITRGRALEISRATIDHAEHERLIWPDYADRRGRCGVEDACHTAQDFVDFVRERRAKRSLARDCVAMAVVAVLATLWAALAGCALIEMAPGEGGRSRWVKALEVPVELQPRGDWIPLEQYADWRVTHREWVGPVLRERLRRGLDVRWYEFDPDSQTYRAIEPPVPALLSVEVNR